MKNRSFGLTLIETLVTLALVAILASLAVPSYRAQFAKRATAAAADAFVSDMRFARSEALKRNTLVTVCRSANASTCAGADGHWRDGWLVFIDSGTKGQVDGSDEVLRVQQALPGIASIAHATPGDERSDFTFRATGTGSDANSLLVVTPTGSIPFQSTRLVCISKPGRASLTKPGSVPADCP